MVDWRVAIYAVLFTGRLFRVALQAGLVFEKVVEKNFCDDYSTEKLYLDVEMADWVVVGFSRTNGRVYLTHDVFDTHGCEVGSLMALVV